MANGDTVLKSICPLCGKECGFQEFSRGYHVVTDGHVIARGTAHVSAYGSARVEAYDQAQVVAYDQTQVVAHDHAQVVTYDQADETGQVKEGGGDERQNSQGDGLPGV